MVCFGVDVVEQADPLVNYGMPWEADQRHVGLLFGKLKMDFARTSPVCTPFVKERKRVDEYLLDVGVDLADVLGPVHARQDGASASPAGAAPGKQHLITSLSYSEARCSHDSGCAH